MGKAASTSYYLAMTRKEYLSLCRDVSEYPDGSGGIKPRLPPELLVTYDGIMYYPLHYEMHFSKGEYYDIAALHSLKANSLCFAPLEDIKPYL